MKPNEIDDATTADDNFGFKSVLTPPKNGHFDAFEEDYTTLRLILSLKELIRYFKIDLVKIYD